MKKLSKKYDKLRKWRSFKRHSFIIFESFLISLAILFLWHTLRTGGFYFARHDEVILSAAVVPTIALAYSVLAALVLNSVWDKYRKVVIAVLEKNKRSFLLLRDEKMPVIIHILLASLTFPLLGITITFQYQEWWSGAASVFSIAFILSLYWIVVIKLEDPAESPWFAERIPEEWLHEDVDKFFELENGNNKKIKNSR